MLSEFHFLRPLWLLTLLPLALLLWQRLRADGDADIWRQVVDPHLLPRLLRGETQHPGHFPEGSVVAVARNLVPSDALVLAGKGVVGLATDVAMMGIALVAARARRRRLASKPSSSGITRSMMTRSGPALCARSSASRPSPASITRMPTAVRSRLKNARACGW